VEPGLILRTERLVLRQWRDSDLAPFRAMNTDPEVGRYFSTMLTAEQSDPSANRIREMIEEHGYGFWAVEIPGVTNFVACTVPPNTASREVMENLGMAHVPEHDVDHPAVAPGTRCDQISYTMSAAPKTLFTGGKI
jgi:RimJ/RimL family protein N-acetyltransferase